MQEGAWQQGARCHLGMHHAWQDVLCPITWSAASFIVSLHAFVRVLLLVLRRVFSPVVVSLADALQSFADEQLVVY
jgi:hypothetical protein